MFYVTQIQKLEKTRRSSEIHFDKLTVCCSFPNVLFHLKVHVVGSQMGRTGEELDNIVLS